MKKIRYYFFSFFALFIINTLLSMSPPVPQPNTATPPTPTTTSTTPTLPLAATQPTSSSPTPVTITQQPVTTTAPTAGVTTLTAEVEQELKTLNSTIEEIHATKKELKTILRQLDDEQQKVRTNVTNARQATKAILTITQESEAQVKLDEVTKNLKEITDSQNKIAGESTQKVDTLLKKIQDLITKAQTSIKTLQNKGITMQIIQTKVDIGTTESITSDSPQKQQPRSMAKKIKEESWWDSVASFFAKVSHRVTRVFNKIKNILTGSETQEAVKKKSHEPTSAVVQTTTPKFSAAIEEKIKKNTKELDNTTKNIQEAQTSLTTKLDTLDKQNEELISTLRPEKSTSLKKPSPATIPREATWKRITMLLFSEFLDFVAFIVNGIKDTVIWAYQKILAPLTTKFIHDVKNKIKQEEQKETSPLPPPTAKLTEIPATNTTEQQPPTTTPLTTPIPTNA